MSGYITLRFPWRGVEARVCESEVKADTPVIQLQNNRLTDLPNELTKLTSITCLALRDNHITSLPPCLSQLTPLIDLDFHGNNLEESPVANTLLLL